MAVWVDARVYECVVISISHVCISNIESNVCVCLCVFCHIHLSCPYQCNIESNMLKQYNTAHIFEILVIEFNDLLWGQDMREGDHFLSGVASIWT